MATFVRDCKRVDACICEDEQRGQRIEGKGMWSVVPEEGTGRQWKGGEVALVEEGLDEFASFQQGGWW